MNTSNFEAADSSLGFYYQSAYSLILLSQTSDDGIVSVETIDDVKLSDGAALTLGQLKHSIGTPPAFNEKDDGLWKTLKNWISIEDWGKYQFMFVTCANLSENCDLSCLSQPYPKRDYSKALECLQVEAKRVVDTPTKELAEGIKRVTGYDYKVKRPACQSFLDLSDKQQELLISKLTLVTASFNAGDVETELQKGLLLAEPKRTRAIIAERLIEWWDRRVARSLIGKSSREIEKVELLERLSSIRSELALLKLPNDFGKKKPEDLSSEIGCNMQKQIELVDGGPPRINRAALVRWQARNQRDKWTDDSLAFADELDEYDAMLISEWKNKHDIMAYDEKEADGKKKKVLGLQLLDWSHDNAHLELQPFKDGLDLPFIVRGTFQQLAEELLVGWHIDYKSHCIQEATKMRWHNDD